MLSDDHADHKPVFLTEDQFATPTLAITDFFQQFSLEYIRRELCDFLEAGIGYDGSYPNDFSPWLAWMAYNHVLCLVEAGWRMVAGSQAQTDPHGKENIETFK